MITNNTEAYKAAEEIDQMIQTNHLDHINEQNPLTKYGCVTVLLYLRTIQTTLDIYKAMVEARLETLKLEKELKNRDE